MNVWLWIRLVLAVALALLALHVVILFNNKFSWMLTLLATEFGHRLAVLAIFLLLLFFWVPGWPSRCATVLLLFSAPVLLIPLWQSQRLVRDLHPAMREAFHSLQPRAATSEAAFSGLWLGRKPALVKPVEHIYTEESGRPRRLLFHPAVNRADAPCLVILHGGGWQGGTPAEFPEWSSWWSQQGYAVAAIEYRLSPEYQWPAPREDVRLALQWMQSRAGELGISGRSFILLGRSAGGQIATACAYGLQDPSIVGCVSIYGPADMFFARSFAFEDDLLNSLRLLRNYLGGDPELAGENYTSASSYLLASAQSCPTLLIHGTRDALVWNMQSRRLAAKLQSFAVPHYLLELPWATHGFDWPFDSPGGQLTRLAVDEFLEIVTSTNKLPR